MAEIMLRVLLLVIVLCGHLVVGANVLLLAFDSESSWIRLASIGKALSDRNHQITVLTPESNLKRIQSYGRDRGFTFRTFQTDGDDIGMVNDRIKEMLWEDNMITQVTTLYNIFYTGEQWCVNLLDNEYVVKSAAQFDIVLSGFMEPCGYILPIVHHLPSVLVTGQFNSAIGWFGVPLPIAYVPSSTSELSDDMDFWDRTQNSLYYLQWLLFEFLLDSLHRLKFSHDPNLTSLTAALRQVDLLLVSSDFAVDFPRPTNPNVINIGGVMAKPASALPEDLESFMVSSGDHGVILLSLGTYAGDMSSSLVDVFASVFSQLPQKVLWKHSGETPTNLGTNTRMVKWLPQNDILGHEKTKLFITHCGSNGMYEAVYHAVPMVFLPLAEDQPDNAVRGVARGLGVRLDIKTVTEKELLQSINEVLYNDSFKANVVKASRIMLDQPQQPMERAVWWIEHVIRHGGLSHLRSKGSDISLYQYLLLDVIGAFLVASITGVVVLTWACKMCCHRVSSKVVKQKRE